MHNRQYFRTDGRWLHRDRILQRQCCKKIITFVHFGRNFRVNWGWKCELSVEYIRVRTRTLVVRYVNPYRTRSVWIIDVSTTPISNSIFSKTKPRMNKLCSSFYNLFLFLESNRCHIIQSVVKRIGYVQRVRFNWKTSKYLEKYEKQEKMFHTKIVRYQGCGIFYCCLSGLAMALLVLRRSY